MTISHLKHVGFVSTHRQRPHRQYWQVDSTPLVVTIRGLQGLVDAAKAASRLLVRISLSGSTADSIKRCLCWSAIAWY
jgi:hypothetical protein